MQQKYESYISVTKTKNVRYGTPQRPCALRLVEIFCLVETFVSECLNFN